MKYFYMVLRRGHKWCGVVARRESTSKHERSAPERARRPALCLPARARWLLAIEPGRHMRGAMRDGESVLRLLVALPRRASEIVASRSRLLAAAAMPRDEAILRGLCITAARSWAMRIGERICPCTPAGT